MIPAWQQVALFLVAFVVITFVVVAILVARGDSSLVHHAETQLRRRLRRLLQKVHAALDVSDAERPFPYRYWIDWGTLLGVVRDGDLILGDMDIDIGFWAPDHVSKEEIGNWVRARMRRWSSVRVATRPTRKLCIRDGNALTGVECDVYIYRMRRDHAVLQYPLALAQPDKRNFCRADVFDFDHGGGGGGATMRHHEWRGLSLPIPLDPPRYLHHIYGATWTTPIRHDKGIDGGRTHRMHRFWKDFAKVCRYGILGS